MGPGRAVLTTQGMGLVQPITDKVVESIDPELLDDLILIVDHVLLASLARFAAGEINVEAIVPIMDRTLARVLGVEPARWGRRRCVSLMPCWPLARPMAGGDEPRHRDRRRQRHGPRMRRAAAR